MRLSVPRKRTTERDFFRSRFAAMLRASVRDAEILADMFWQYGHTYDRLCAEGQQVEARAVLDKMQGAAKILKLGVASNVCYHRLAIVTIEEMLVIPPTKLTRDERRKMRDESCL